MNNYEIIVYWNIEDNAFIAEVPELVGCMADGKTLFMKSIKETEIKGYYWRILHDK